MGKENQYYEHLHAYTLGCLDKEEFEELRNYLQTTSEFSWQELGEYQNLTALLPSILNIEIPGLHVKDKVARKLYRLREEAKAKKAGELKTPRFTSQQPPEEEQIKEFVVEEEPEEKPFVPPPPIPKEKPEEIIQVEAEKPVIQTEDKAEQEFELETESPPIPDMDGKESFDQMAGEEDISASPVQDFEVVSPARKTSELYRPSQHTQISERDTKSLITKLKEKTAAEKEMKKIRGKVTEAPPPPKAPAAADEIEIPEPVPSFKRTARHPSYIEEPKKKKINFTLIGSIILFVIVGLGLLYVYQKLSADVNKYQGEIDRLNQEIKSLSGSIEKNQDLQNILDSENLKIITFSRTNWIQTGGGKLVISLDQSKGFIQFYQMPSPPQDKAYQLWVKISTIFIPLGIFNPILPIEYYPFDLPQLSSEPKTDFILTEEPVGGSDKPGRKVILTGSLQ